MEVMPLRVIRHSIPSLTAAELKHKVLLAYRIDHIFRDQQIIHPKSVQAHSVEMNVNKVDISPGGEWLITVDGDGGFLLRDTQDISGPPGCAVYIPEHPVEWRWDGSTLMLLSTVGKECVSIVCDRFYIENTCVLDRLHSC